MANHCPFIKKLSGPSEKTRLRCFVYVFSVSPSRFIDKTWFCCFVYSFFFYRISSSFTLCVLCISTSFLFILLLFLYLKWWCYLPSLDVTLFIGLDRSLNIFYSPSIKFALVCDLPKTNFSDDNTYNILSISRLSLNLYFSYTHCSYSCRVIPENTLFLW